MKPKTKNNKQQLKKEPIKNETPAPPLATASVALPSAAKQQKRKKTEQAKLKKRAAAAVVVMETQATPAVAASQAAPLSKKQRRLLLKKEKKAKAADFPAAALPKQTELLPASLEKKKKRKLPGVAGEKRLRLMEANGDSSHSGKSPAAAASSKSHPPPPSASAASHQHLADTEPVRDPLLRARIVNYLRRRAASTVRVQKLPNRLRMAQIGELCPGVQALRVPWNYAANRHKGVAFLEFPDPAAAQRAVATINASKKLGVRLAASIRSSDGGETATEDEDVGEKIDVDAYNCRRVVVSSLHPYTTGQELKDLVGGGEVLRVDFQHGSKMLRKSAPAAAFLTFADERRALDAVEKFQGHVLRSRPTSWTLQRRAKTTGEHAPHPTQLVAFGVSKRVTDEDLLKAFPNSQKLDVRQGSGMAVVTYASAAECRTDFDACKGGVARAGKAKLRVQFGYAHHQGGGGAGSGGADSTAQSASQKKKAKKLQQQQQAQKQQREKQKQQPPKPASNIDPSLFNKRQLVLKNFKPATQEADFTGLLAGVRRVFFTGNRRLAFVHFDSESAAADALKRLTVGGELLNGAKLKAMYAMDKPDKKKQHPSLPEEQQQLSGQATTEGEQAEPAKKSNKLLLSKKKQQQKVLGSGKEAVADTFQVQDDDPMQGMDAATGRAIQQKQVRQKQFKQPGSKLIKGKKLAVVAAAAGKPAGKMGKTKRNLITAA